MSFFITGTDTNVGKTLVTTALIKFYNLKGIKAVPFKPVQTGGIEDTNFIFKENELLLPKEHCYSYSFDKPCSPHLAAKLDGKKISFNKIVDDFKKLSTKYEMVIVEGAGGIMVPLGDGKYMVDLIIEFQLPVILVVANRLGAINQAMLSIDKLTRVGRTPELIVFNDILLEDEVILSDNVNTVKELSGVNNVLRIPYMTEVQIESVVKMLGDFNGFNF